MKDVNDRTVFAILILSVMAVIFSSLYFWWGFGVVGFGLVVTILGLGFGPTRRSKPIFYFLFFLFSAYALLLSGMVWIDRHDIALRLVWGFPAATAFLIYGIWLVPALAGVIYAIVFHSAVLPEDKLQKFLTDHGTRERKP